MTGCELITDCEFFQRYEASPNRLCQGFIACYCQGPLGDRCARKGNAGEQGSPPDPRMMPSGELLE